MPGRKFRLARFHRFDGDHKHFGVQNGVRRMASGV